MSPNLPYVYYINQKSIPLLNHIWLALTTYEIPKDKFCKLFFAFIDSW